MKLVRIGPLASVSWGSTGTAISAHMTPLETMIRPARIDSTLGVCERKPSLTTTSTDKQIRSFAVLCFQQFWKRRLLNSVLPEVRSLADTPQLGFQVLRLKALWAGKILVKI